MFSVQYKLEFEKIYLGKDNTSSKIKINKKKIKEERMEKHLMKWDMKYLLKHRNLILRCQW